MRRMFLQVAAALLGVLSLTVQAQAQQAVAGARVAKSGPVTILTDTITDSDSRATRAINELAARPDQIGDIRVMAVAGHGAVANVNDLLNLQGIDLAVLNQDVFEYMRRTGQHTDAKNRIRYVSHLFDQKVYLLARREFDKIEALRGRKLAVGTEGGSITAATVFGLSGIDLAIEVVGHDKVLDETVLATFDAVLVKTDELAKMKMDAQTRQQWRALPIRLTPAISSTYERATIEASELPGFAHQGEVSTISVATLLATYNWSPSHGARYHNASHFMRTFLSALPRLRKQSTAAGWRQVDINAKISGWQRHEAALPDRVFGPQDLAELAIVEKSRAVVPPVPLPAAEIPTRDAKGKAKVLALMKAPLADEALPDGGLVTALVRSALTSSNGAGTRRIDLEMMWSKAEQQSFQKVLDDPSIDLSWPWVSSDCDRPSDLAHEAAVLCDNAIFSDAVLQTVESLFIPNDRTFAFDRDDAILGKTLCLPANQELSLLNGPNRAWIAESRLVVLRRPTLLECVSAVQTLEADAFVATDLEGRYVLERLGLDFQFQMADRPLGVRGIHLIASKTSANAAEFIEAVNQGLALLKKSDAYAAIIQKHLLRLAPYKAAASP